MNSKYKQSNYQNFKSLSINITLKYPTSTINQELQKNKFNVCDNDSLSGKRLKPSFASSQVSEEGNFWQFGGREFV